MLSERSSGMKFNKNTFKAMLAHKYKGQDPTGYYMSHKLDGMRGIYDGNSDTFISRNNKPIISPKFFTKDFPNEVMDGELYTKVDDFSGTGIFRKKIPVDSEWRKGVYMVFDLPMIRKPFEERYQMLKEIVKKANSPHLKLVEHVKVKDLAHMEQYHKNIISKKGEGTMLRLPNTIYENKRSNTLLKVKEFFDDEVVVTGMEFGEGRNQNVMGALNIKWLKPSMGTNEFKVGSGFSDFERDNYKKLFKKGTILTIKYFEIDKYSKRPRFPTFWRIKAKE